MVDSPQSTVVNVSKKLWTMDFRVKLPSFLGFFSTSFCSYKMSITQTDVLKALSTVDDPDLKRDLVSLNMIKDVKVDSRKISFTVVLTTPACPLKEKIRNDCEDAIESAFGKDVEID